MGKSCVRFKRLDDLALDVIADAIGKVSVDDYVGVYERSRAGTAKGAKTAKAAKIAKRAVKKPAAKKPAAKKKTKSRR